MAILFGLLVVSGRSGRMGDQFLGVGVVGFFLYLSAEVSVRKLEIAWYKWTDGRSI